MTQNLESSLTDEISRRNGQSKEKSFFQTAHGSSITFIALEDSRDQKFAWVQKPVQ